MTEQSIKKICDGVYVGNADSAKSQMMLSSANIGAVINLSGNAMKLPMNVFTYSLPSQELLPTERQKTVDKLNIIVRDMQALRTNNVNILIVCDDGKNKSILVAGYYLIIKCAQPYIDTIRDLEMLYYTDQQRVEESEYNARIIAESDPDIPPEIITQEELQRRTQLRTERNTVRCLTMTSFSQLLRIAGGAKK